MDNTDLHYLTYDPDEIWTEMHKAYVEAGGDFLYPGDEKEMLLRSVQADIVQVFAGVDNALRMATLRYAVGPYLDEIGELRGCYRIEAAAAKATVTITVMATGEPGVIAAGTSMTYDGQMFYTLDDDITLTGLAQTETVSVTCDRTGSAGNALEAGSVLTLAVVNPAVTQIVAATSASGGNEAEDDETYRARIREYGLTAISTGPAQKYEAAAKAVSSDIIDAKALNLGGGVVGVYLLFLDGTGKEAIMQAVLDALSPDDVRPLTDQVSVYEATDIPYVLNVKYEYDSSTNISTAIGDAVRAYQEWQDNHIGRAFNPDRLMTALYQAGCTRVTWDAGSVFGDEGDIEYTEIEENERCKGTITLTAVTIVT